jgi:aspartate racemase
MEKTIGVVAGAGPFAGLDLLAKILDQTEASRDQDHLTIISLSKPAHLPDRTGYLLGQTSENPAPAIVEQLLQLESAGAQVAGIPCNTAHAAPIFDMVREGLSRSGSQIHFLNMIEEVALFLQQCHPETKRVGLLATVGTYKTNLYPSYLEPSGIEVLTPDDDAKMSLVHPAIYDTSYGIKACGIATQQAVDDLWASGRQLLGAGAEAIILGCTEIPIAITEKEMDGMVVIDPTLILARALIREANPSKLKRLDCAGR